MVLSEYHIALNIRDALSVMEKAQGGARILAGGTDLMLQQRRGERKVNTLVDITRIPGLDRIEKQGTALILGSLVTHTQAAESPIVRRHLPALAEACGRVGSPQIRNVGTLVGNIVSAQPGADAALALHVYDTKVGIVGRGGERNMALPELYEGVGICCVDSCRELITRLIVQLPQEGCGSSFERLSQRGTLSLPVVNTAVSLRLDRSTGSIVQSRVIVGPVSSIPFEAVKAEAVLAGSDPSSRVFTEAAKAAADEAQPRESLLRGGREYRKCMVEVMVRRALIQALERSKEI